MICTHAIEPNRLVRLAERCARRSGGGKVLLAATAIFLSFVVSSCANPISSTMPPEIRALFEEAEDEIEIRKLGGMPQQHIYSPQDIFWMDNRRLIYSIREHNGWKARDDERSKIIIFDVDSGKIEETKYRGELVCFGLNGEMQVLDYPKPRRSFLLPGDTKEVFRYFIGGVFGGELTKAKRPEGQNFFNRWNCKPYSSLSEEDGKKRVVAPLLDGDGRISIGSFNPGGQNIARYFATDDRLLWQMSLNETCEGILTTAITYLPWERKYFSPIVHSAEKHYRVCAASSRMWLFSPDGNVEAKRLPPPFISLVESGKAGNGKTYWAKRGLYIYLHDGWYGLDGLYWYDESSKKLKRVSKRKYLRLENISPDGCRNLDYAVPHHLVELCKRKTP
jgi:hypothetical protein